MVEFLKYIWNLPFWDTPASAFSVPVVVIGYFTICHYWEKRALRKARAVFATGWDPVKGTQYVHRWWPNKRCRMCYTVNSPNDKFMPSVIIDVERGGICEVQAHVFKSRWKEVNGDTASNQL